MTSLALLCCFSCEELLVSCDTGLFPLSCEPLALLMPEPGSAGEGAEISERGLNPLFGLEGDTGLRLYRGSTLWLLLLAVIGLTSLTEFNVESLSLSLDGSLDRFDSSSLKKLAWMGSKTWLLRAKGGNTALS